MCRSEVFHFKRFAKRPLDRGDFEFYASGDKAIIDVEGDDQDYRGLVTNVEAGVARTARDLNVAEFCVPLATSVLQGIKGFVWFADYICAVRILEDIWDLHGNVFF